ncbi:MAG: hypothetical protein PHG67_03885 [Bacteroidales bacterium]|jgi:hypothetical protein|nr:hypothetical protein [Bacteroidales bacterium]
MKKIIAKLSLITVLTIASTALLAQGPPEPPEDPGEGGGPVGGNAPIGSGLAILLTLGAAYGGRKVYQYWKDQKEELED